jgi:MmyB-like transcription regulator ligand binding domain
LHLAGTKHFHHPVIGDLELYFDGLDLPGQPGHNLTAYSAEPGSPADDGLKLLASWAAGPSQNDPAPARDTQDV